MSLTSHLKDPNSPVTRFLKERFPNTRKAPFLRNARESLSNSVTTQPVPPFSQGVYATIGTAIDYRLRYYFDITHPTELAAFTAYETPSPTLHRDFMSDLEFAIPNLNPKQRRLDEAGENLLNRYCYVLALYDQFKRVAATHLQNSPLNTESPETIDDLLKIPDQAWIKDMRELSWLFHDRYNRLTNRPHILNPTFDGSIDVGGADADIIIDDTLIEIKSSIKPTIDGYYIQELIGYTLLDYSDRYQIRNIGIYMVRQGILLQWELKECLAHLSNYLHYDLGQLRSQFQEMLASQVATK